MSDSQYNSVKEQRQLELSNWIERTAPPVTTMTPVATDAGMRRYFRIDTAELTMIAVDADPQYEDNAAFIDIANRLATSGLHTPDIYHYNLEKGFLLVEDLGTQQLFHWLNENKNNPNTMYRTACDAIIHMQKETRVDGLPCFDNQFIQLELDIFDDWYIGRHLNYEPDSRDKDTISNLRNILITNCEQQPQAFMHRDFHSRNLMVTGDNKLAIIDFQGAMCGPITYDLGSLTRDAYFSITSELELNLCEHHRNSLAQNVAADTFERWYRLTALQRHLKIMGIFCRLNYRDDKPQYLDGLNTVARYITDTLDRYREFSDFRQLFLKLSALRPHQ